MLSKIGRVLAVALLAAGCAGAGSTVAPAGEKAAPPPAKVESLIQSIMYKRGAPDSNWCSIRSCIRIASHERSLRQPSC